VAHRGASADQAEHTLGAYLAALETGAEGLECDVRLTADGHLVCVHDRTLRRTGEKRGLISTSNLEDLADVDFSQWKKPWADLDDEADERDRELGRVLTLRKLLETVADYDRRVEVAIETKHPTRYGGLVERRLVQMLKEFGWHEPGAPVRVMSFSFTALQRMERLAPGVQLVQLMDKPTSYSMLRRVMGESWFVGPGIDLVHGYPKLVRRMGRRRDVHVWTVNTADDLEACLDLGVKAIITDKPSHILELLADREPALDPVAEEPPAQRPEADAE
jgi:glycerophosphoryl diester phosphodiesterase